MSDLHALLIGIDAYLPNRLPNGGTYPPLGGCVRDIRRVETYLQTRLGLPAERITKLTATAPETPPPVTRDDAPPPMQPTEPKERWPTYENIVAAFRQVTEEAQPGDRVYIHYSGHGGRATTVYPEVKGAEGLDEALVPVDIGEPETRYVRDIELAHLLKSMVDRQLRVTLVLDSCHSGGASRKNWMPRGAYIPNGGCDVDETKRRAESLAGSREELLASWQGLQHQGERGGKVYRDITAATDWLPKPQGYVLVAACTPRQSAYEGDFGDAGRSGALTHWWLDSLKHSAAGATYRDLFQRIEAEIRKEEIAQTPMLLGEENWVAWEGGGEESEGLRSPSKAVLVLAVDLAGRRVLLNTGQAQGIRDGARFALRPPGEDRCDPPCVEVEIAGFGATESWATFLADPSRPPAEGDQAVLIDPGANLRTVVRLLEGSEEPRDPVWSELRRLVAELPALRLAAEGESASLAVAIHQSGEIEIWDGSQKVPHLKPPLKVDDPEAPAKTVERLAHLGRYQAIVRLGNFNGSSPLAGKLSVTLLGVQE
ncbi:MAG TPA: caspase family protein, partial [Thermoanaerobaculia bacterium]|nr:caspase family protein [Thermoanaerobaculia bacterium]